MKNILLLCLLLLFTTNTVSQDSLKVNVQDTLKPIPFDYPFGDPEIDTPRGVFGKDDRKDVTDAEGIEDFVRATATMIHKRNLVINDAGNYLFYGTTLRDRLTKRYESNNFHKNVKFLDQPTIANCTGFLIGPDILVTAGHCIDNINDAKNYVWVFDYTNELDFIKSTVYKGKKYIVVNPKNVYHVSEFIDGYFGEDEYDDWSVLRLDRKSERAPYRFRTSGEVQLNSKINTIGSPTGLPLKFADNAKVMGVSEKKYFKTDIDVFPGNSGGPAFAKYGFLEGIIVMTSAVATSDGDTSADYIFDKNCNCIRTVKFSNAKYRFGSTAHRIKEMPYWILKMALYENIQYAIEHNLNDRLDSWLIYSWILDSEYTNKRGRLEINAAEYNNTYAFKKIIEKSNKENYNLFAYAAFRNAIVHENIEIINFILDQEIDLEALSIDKQSLLLFAMENNKIEIVKLLINNGWNINILDLYGNNLLHLAARMNNFDLIKYFVELGVDVNKKNYRGWRPEKVAKKNKHRSAFKYLKRVRKRGV